MAIPSAKKLSAELAELAESPALIASERGTATLASALASRSAPVLAQAAKLVAEHRVRGLEEPMRAAYRALAGDRAQSIDAGAHAKEALVAALEAVEDVDATLFAEAASCVQLERARGGSRDTAAGVRTRGALGLARLGHPDLLLLLGACLADADATVRLSAARALVHRGDRDGAGLLLLRLGAGEDVPEIVTECIHGLFAMAPDFGVRQARAALRSTSARTREHVLHALGTTPHDDAAELLVAELGTEVDPDGRRALIEALGLSLRPAARAALLALLEADGRTEAEAALMALAIHRYDEKLAARVRELTEHDDWLSERGRDLFGPG